MTFCIALRMMCLGYSIRRRGWSNVGWSIKLVNDVICDMHGRVLDEDRMADRIEHEDILAGDWEIYEG